MKKILALIVAALVFGTLGTAAYAGGSDSPTPYSVTKSGITLPAGDTFRDNGHVNIHAYNLDGSPRNSIDQHFESKCIERQGRPECGDPNDPSTRAAMAQYIGKSFIPWSAFGLFGNFCVGWVQISHYNEHFGEGGQPKVGPGCNEPTPEPTTPTPTPTETPTVTPTTPEPTPTATPTTPEPTEPTVTPEPPVDTPETPVTPPETNAPPKTDTPPAADKPEAPKKDIGTPVHIEEKSHDEPGVINTLPNAGGPSIIAGIVAVLAVIVGGVLLFRRKR